MADLCAIIARRRHEKIFEELAAAGRMGLQLLEVRLDFLSRQPRLKDILARRPAPLIATIRRREDGGLWNGTEEKRRTLLVMVAIDRQRKIYGRPRQPCSCGRQSSQTQRQSENNK